MERVEIVGDGYDESLRIQFRREHRELTIEADLVSMPKTGTVTLEEQSGIPIGQVKEGGNSHTAYYAPNTDNQIIRIEFTNSFYDEIEAKAKEFAETKGVR